MLDWLTEKQLLDAARRHGGKVSTNQLKRWRDAELIPRPVQSHPRGQHGSVALYPPGTLTQLLTVTKLRQSFKKLDRIRFELWWDGAYDGQTASIRALRVAQLDAALSPLRDHRDSYESPFDAAEAAVAGEALAGPDPALRAMRRLAKGSENLQSAAHAIFEELFGGSPVWDGASAGPDEAEPSLRELVERVTGVARAKADTLTNDVPLLPADADIVQAIRTFNRLRVFDLDEPGWALRQAMDGDLEGARQQARLLLEALSDFAAIIERQGGRDHAGLSVFRGLNKPTLLARAIATQFSLMLPALLVTAEERSNVARNLQALSENRIGMRCGEMFLTEHPGYTFLLQPGATERLRSLPHEEYAVIDQTFREFLSRHPECGEDTARTR